VLLSAVENLNTKGMYTSKLQEHTANMMIHKHLPKSEENRLQKLWDQIDVDGDGDVSYQEMFLSLSIIKNDEKQAKK